MVAQVKLKPTHAQPGLFRSPTRGSFCPTNFPIGPIATPRVVTHTMVAQVKLKPTHAQPGLFRSPTRGSFCPTILPIAPITTISRQSNIKLTPSTFSLDYLVRETFSLCYSARRQSHQFVFIVLSDRAKVDTIRLASLQKAT